MLKNFRHLEHVRGTRKFLKKSKEYLLKSSDLYHNLKEPSTFGQLSAHYVSYNGVISGLSGVPVDLGSKLTHCTCLAMITKIVTIFKATNKTMSDISRKNTVLG